MHSPLVFCRTISTCYELGDYRRAGEWMDAIAECSARTGIDSLPGDCQAHSIAILVGRGAWAEGEVRARDACGGMEPFELTHVGLALSGIGEIRLRMGDLDGAAEAFSKATENAAPPQPGTALLLLARGDTAGAAASIGEALAEAGWNNLARARLLPAQVEIALADDDIATARSAVAELAELATVFASPAIPAAADSARGATLLAEGERSRGRGELHAARGTFESLGAALDLDRLAELDKAFAASACELADLRQRLARSVGHLFEPTVQTNKSLELLGRAHLLVAVAHHIDHIAIRGTHEEPSHAPRLFRERVNDLVPPSLRLRVRLINAGADVNRDDRVMRRRGVATDQLDGGLATRRSVARHPPQVEFLNTQPEVVGVEVTGSSDVSDRKVRIDAGYSHGSSSSRTDAADRSGRSPRP